MIEHIKAKTLHARHGAIKNSFDYNLDYILTDFAAPFPLLLSHNRFSLWSLWDRNHGGERDHGRGLAWFKEQLSARNFPVERAKLMLLTQPSFLWFNFNPVSFWIALIDGQTCAFVAEVNSTFGQRHCYFCAHDDFHPIDRHDKFIAQKRMHVSPFQKVEGQYVFNFGFDQNKINIKIDYQNRDQGVLATISGRRKLASNRSLLWASIRKPFGPMRVVTLIHWQAIVLYFKRAPFLKRQPAPDSLTSDGGLKK